MEVERSEDCYLCKSLNVFDLKDKREYWLMTEMFVFLHGGDTCPHTKNKGKKIDAVYRFENGMCMVFDKDGKQMPEYQGKWSKMKYSIIEDLPKNASIKPVRSWT